MRYIGCLFLTILLGCLTATGQESEPSDSIVCGDATCTNCGKGGICYDVASLAEAQRAEGKRIPKFLDLLANTVPGFDGDDDTFREDVHTYLNAGVSTRSVDYSSSFTHSFPSDQSRTKYLSNYGRHDFGNGVWHFGPRYKRNSIVWFVNGRFLFITNCKARVRFDTDVYRASLIDYLPESVDLVKSVRIVEGDKDFRSHIPHLKSWRGKTPTLIFVTTKHGTDAGGDCHQ